MQYIAYHQTELGKSPGGAATPGVTAIHQEATAGSPTVINVDDPPGRYVRIQLESRQHPLSLAEVAVRSDDGVG